MIFTTCCGRASRPPPRRPKWTASSACLSKRSPPGRMCCTSAFPPACRAPIRRAAWRLPSSLRATPDRKVLCVDSLAATGGEYLLVDKAREMRDQGCTAEETAAEIERLCLQVVHLFTVDDLNHLYRGGRLSRASAIVGSLLGIKPLLYMDDAGKLCVHGKLRGRQNVIRWLAERARCAASPTGTRRSASPTATVWRTPSCWRICWPRAAFRRISAMSARSSARTPDRVCWRYSSSASSVSRNKIILRRAKPALRGRLEAVEKVFAPQARIQIESSGGTAAFIKSGGMYLGFYTNTLHFSGIPSQAVKCLYNIAFERFTELLSKDTSHFFVLFFITSP